MMGQEVVRIGSRVRVRDEDGEAEFELAGELADSFVGRVSVDSPLGKALLGHRSGDCIRFRAPGGVRAVLLVAVELADDVRWSADCCS